jgi:hypothetical protein
VADARFPAALEPLLESVEDDRVSLRDQRQLPIGIVTGYRRPSS